MTDHLKGGLVYGFLFSVFETLGSASQEAELTRQDYFRGTHTQRGKSRACVQEMCSVLIT